MPSFGDPFTESVIQDLAKRPTTNPRPPTGPGFSYPQRGWIYQSAVSYYGAGGSAEAMWNRLDEELLKGKGRTPWKVEKGRIVRDRLSTMVEWATRDEASFARSRYVERPSAVIWRGHRIAVRLGLEFVGGRETFLRFLWTEQRLMAPARGRSMVVVAALAAADAMDLRRYSRIEVWHLAEKSVSRYAATDLRSLYSGFERMLAQAEARRGVGSS